MYIHISYLCREGIAYSSPAPPRPTFFPITLTVSLPGQPSAICYLQKKQKTMHSRAFSPSPSQSRSPKTFFLLFLLCFCFFVAFFSWYPLPFQNPTQNKSSNMCVCLFFLEWGRGGELIINNLNILRASLFGWIKHSKLNSISIRIEKACGKINLKLEMYFIEVCKTLF